MKRLVLAAGCCLLASCEAHSGNLRVRLALQPPSTNNYPSHLAKWLDFYRQEGLEVSISEIAGASKVLEAVVGGSADVGGGVYEQTIQMAAEDRNIVSFISLLRSPNFAIVAMPDHAVRSVADLKGRMAGVSSVGSPSQFYLNYLLLAAGIQPVEVSTTNVGMGATAVVAVERSQVDAAILFGSAVTVLESRQRGLLILADTRTPEGLRAVFGVNDYPASCLLAREEWLRANPGVARRIARAVLRSLTWIREHSADDILARIPPESRAGDPAAEIAAIKLAKPMYSVDGRISQKSAEAVRKVLAGSLDRVRDAKIDLSKTYTNEFLQ